MNGIGDALYFAPNIAFSQVDLGSPSLGRLWGRRLDAYYLDPADTSIRAGHAFAAGLVLIAAIDAMARVQLRSASGPMTLVHGREFVGFLVVELPSFDDPAVATRFYSDFRNGLVHEARIKNAGEFSLAAERTVSQRGDVISVNPQHLLGEVRDALERFMERVGRDEAVRREFAALLSADFANELAAGSGMLESR